MADAKKDDNRVTTALAVTNDANLTPELLRVDPSTFRLLVNSTITGTLTIDTTGLATSANQLPDNHQVTISNASLAVTGTFWQATQPVSGTFWQATQPVSIAATVTEDGSGVTQPVSNAGLTALNGAITGTEVQVDVLTMPTVTVTATDLDIRNLTSTDVVTVTGGAGQTADVKITLDSESVAVTNAGITTIAGAVAGTEMQVDVLTMPTVAVTGTFWQTTQPVSLASVPPHEVTITSGSVTADTELPSAAALSDGLANPTTSTIGSMLMGWSGGSWDRLFAFAPADDANNDRGLLTNSRLMAYDGATWDMVRGDSSNGLLVNLGTNNDIGINAGTNAVGKLLPSDVDITTHTNYAKKYYTSAGAVTDGIIWSPGAGKRWHVTCLYLNVSAAATVTLEDDLGAGDSAVWKGELAANSGVVIPFGEKYPLASGEDAADLLITTSAGNVYVTCVGYEI